MEHPDDALGGDHNRQRQADVGYSLQAVQADRQRLGAVGVHRDRFDDQSRRHCDREVGVAFAIDHVEAGAAGVVEDFARGVIVDDPRPAGYREAE